MIMYVIHCSMYNVVNIVVVHRGAHVKYLCGITTYKLLLICLFSLYCECVLVLCVCTVCDDVTGLYSAATEGGGNSVEQR